MVIGYVRVSTEKQDMKNQHHEILEYANRCKMHVDEMFEVEVSTRKDMKTRKIDVVARKLQKGDTLIVSELSRLGRSIVEIISIINELIKMHVTVIAIKQGIKINGNHDVQSKVLITVFSLLAELERDMISERTKMALAAKRAQGVVLGRPKGRIGKSKLDGRVPEILDLMRDKAGYSFMARRFKVSRPTLMNFIKSRKLIG